MHKLSIKKAGGFFLAVMMSLTIIQDGQAQPALQDASALLCGTPVAVAYSGFREGQHPDRGEGAVNPSDAEILEDLQILAKNANFPLIRLYDSNENSESVLQIIKQNELNIKVLLGVWLDAELSNHENCSWLPGPIPPETLAANKLKNARQVERGIRLAQTYPNIVAAVNVGNEALVSWTDHLVSEDSVIAYVKKVKRAIKQPVTVAENYEWWIKQGKTLANELDFIAIHTYPVWEGRDIDAGLSYAIENIMQVRNAIPDAKIVITETGWATLASEFGERAGESKQKRYCQEILDWTAKNHVTIFLFEAFDEPWKGDPNNPLGAEKHWGLFTVDRKAKKVMYEWYPERIPAKE